MVNVYLLHDRESMTEDVLNFIKNDDTSFQPPGCKQDNQNGINLPAWIKVPIPSRELQPSYLIDWLRAKAVAKFLLSGDEADL